MTYHQSIKKLVALILTMSILFSMTSFGVYSATTFTDTKSSDWFATALTKLYERKMVNGFPDGSFKPSQILQYDELIAILCRLHGVTLENGSPYWATPFIEYAQTNGWLKGITVTNYRLPISRKEASLMMAQSVELEVPDNLSGYSIYIKDYNKLTTAYRNAVLLCFANGIITGYPDSEFKGDRSITRAEMTVMGYRMIDKKQRKIPLNPTKSEKLEEVFALPAFPAFTNFEDELALIDSKLQYMNPATGGFIGGNQTALPPFITGISENTLADAILYMGDSDTNHVLSGGYSYGLYNINLLTQENESILIYTALDEQYKVLIDLVFMIDEFGVFREDARELLRIVTGHISQEYGQAMYDFIITNYENRELITMTGARSEFGDIDLEMKAIIQDHSIIQVEITFPE